MSDPDFFATARRDARTAFQDGRVVAGHAARPPCLLSHWAYYDSPYYALCGEPIRAEQRTHTPSCPACLRQLEQMRLEDQR